MVYWHRLIMVDYSFGWVERTVHLTEDPGTEIVEGNCVRQFLGWGKLKVKKTKHYSI